MRVLILGFTTLLLVGCQSDKLPEASGSWTPVNNNRILSEPPLTDAERVKVFGCMTNNPVTCK